MVSGLGRVILILFVFTAELCASYPQNVESAIWDFPNNYRVHSRCQTGVFSECVWHGTQWFKALCKTPRYDNIPMQCYCYDACCVLYVCFGCVMNVLWECYESVMKALWRCYESVMKVLWKCYGCVMAVLWLCYGCVKNVCVMDEWWIFHIYCVSCISNGIVIVIL